MAKSHNILVLLWVMFSVLHSLFANEKWKKKVQIVLKKNYKFYRIVYSFFALITLAIVVTYNFSMQSFPLWNVNIIEQVIAVACMLSCGTIMLLFTRKFFFDLSGADVFQKKQLSRELIKTDLYKYVRHPLYSATLGFVWSIFLYSPLFSNLISCICITAYTIAGIYLEEKKLVYEFGDNYISYRSQTPMLIPKIFY
ncbi:MAG TPA: isoprenylcysteine carboxylmethyltransferase family protein [Parafilimonas sp.]|nr:isoprenylcysteine carboxylmethyltransferase family protein [Parafilimonas sp.]